MSKAWVVLRCEAKKERIAAKGLQRFVQVYLPSFEKVIPRRGHKVIRVPTLLFPGYILARTPLPPNYDRIRTVPGLMKCAPSPVMMLEGRVATLTPDDITVIAEAAAKQNRLEAEKLQLPAVGSTITIDDGVFAGQRADVIETAEDHLVLLFTLLGRGVPVQIPNRQLAGSF